MFIKIIKMWAHIKIGTNYLVKYQIITRILFKAQTDAINSY